MDYIEYMLHELGIEYGDDPHGAVRREVQRLRTNLEEARSEEDRLRSLLDTPETCKDIASCRRCRACNGTGRRVHCDEYHAHHDRCLVTCECAELPRTPQVGDVVHLDGAEWTVCGPERDGKWPLSGPGPCRGMRYATREELLASRLVEQGAGEIIVRYRKCNWARSTAWADLEANPPEGVVRRPIEGKSNPWSRCHTEGYWGWRTSTLETDR